MKLKMSVDNVFQDLSNTICELKKPIGFDNVSGDLKITQYDNSTRGNEFKVGEEYEVNITKVNKYSQDVLSESINNMTIKHLNGLLGWYKCIDKTNMKVQKSMGEKIILLTDALRFYCSCPAKEFDKGDKAREVLKKHDAEWYNKSQIKAVEYRTVKIDDDRIKFYRNDEHIVSVFKTQYNNRMDGVINAWTNYGELPIT